MSDITDLIDQNIEKIRKLFQEGDRASLGKSQETQLIEFLESVSQQLMGDRTNLQKIKQTLLPYNSIQASSLATRPTET